MATAQSVDIELLRPNGFNTNIVSPENERKLDEAIRRLGMFKPIVVRETDAGYEILGGEHRWESAKRLGYTEVPVMNVGRIDDKIAKEICLADNSRYGADDTIALAELLNDLGSPQELQSFLPYSDTDLSEIFASTDIALDELDIDEEVAASDRNQEPASAKTPKTHTIMRFKVPLIDAERITDLIARTQKRHSYDSADELTNAGDALVHLLLSGKES